MSMKTRLAVQIGSQNVGASNSGHETGELRGRCTHSCRDTECPWRAASVFSPMANLIRDLNSAGKKNRELTDSAIAGAWSWTALFVVATVFPANRPGPVGLAAPAVSAIAGYRQCFGR
jgi:hypothetical protein